MLQAAQRTQRRLPALWYYAQSLTQGVPEVEGSQWCQLLTRQRSGATATSSEITAGGEGHRRASRDLFCWFKQHWWIAVEPMTKDVST